MPERNIAVRVTTREIRNAIVYEPPTGDPVRFTRELMPIPRVKIVGLLRIDPAIRKGEEKNYMNLIIDDIFGSVNVFVFDSALLENISENIRKGNIVQVVGKVRSGKDRNIIIAEGVNIVTPETYVYHLYKVAKQLKRHYEYLRIMKRIDELKKKASLVRAQGGSAGIAKAGKLLTEASSLKSVLPQQYITIMDAVEQYIIETFYADIGLEEDFDEEVDEEETYEENIELEEFEPTPKRKLTGYTREKRTTKIEDKPKKKIAIDEEEIEDISEEDFEIIEDTDEEDNELEEFDEIDEI